MVDKKGDVWCPPYSALSLSFFCFAVYPVVTFVYIICTVDMICQNVVFDFLPNCVLFIHK